MNVASLGLCKELYELSGWYEVEAYYEDYPVLRDSKLRSGYPGNILPKMLHDNITPAYDLGYLLRKLPDQLTLVRVRDSPAYYIGCDYRQPYIETEADTPEDAACKLAIELLKQGILQPNLQESEK